MSSPIPFQAFGKRNLINITPPHNQTPAVTLGPLCFCPTRYCEEWCSNFRNQSELTTHILMKKGTWFIEQNKSQTGLRITHTCRSPRVLWKIIMVQADEPYGLYAGPEQISNNRLIDNKCSFCVEEIPEELLTVYKLHDLGTRWP